MTEYAIEADPGKCTASFPTFDSLDAALAAASAPAMVRKGLPLPRVLTRRGGQWYAVCAAPTWHGPCILLKGHDPGSAYHRGGGQDQFERSEYEGNWTQSAQPESGLDRSRRAVARAAGWPWCEEHKRPRWDGSDPCDHLHPKPPAVTYDEDGAPEPPFGGERR